MQINKENNEIKCLDKGFVRLVDYMGDDSSIVQAARVSYGKGTKEVNQDRGLIRYLMRHKHTTPFEMVEFKFHVKLPIFVARQWIRHRTANVNEYSGRYSEMKDDFYLPEIQNIRPQSSNNKQGRADTGFENAEAVNLQNKLGSFQEDAFSHYQKLLDTGLAREIARINLPVSNYTEWYWKIDLHNLFHFLKLRMDSHAQYEIRVYAYAMTEIVKSIVPVAYEAFEDYILNARNFSQKELLIIKDLIKEMPEDDLLAQKGLSKREINEFKEKFGI
jgi:thymidylate synthase (FAD)